MYDVESCNVKPGSKTGSEGRNLQWTTAGECDIWRQETQTSAKMKGPGCSLNCSDRVHDSLHAATHYRALVGGRDGNNKGAFPVRPRHKTVCDTGTGVDTATTAYAIYDRMHNICCYIRSWLRFQDARRVTCTATVSRWHTVCVQLMIEVALYQGKIKEITAALMITSHRQWSVWFTNRAKSPGSTLFWTFLGWTTFSITFIIFQFCSWPCCLDEWNPHFSQWKAESICLRDEKCPRTFS